MKTFSSGLIMQFFRVKLSAKKVHEFFIISGFIAIVEKQVSLYPSDQA